LQYTPNQQKAINYWEGNLQIIACAGSGKTDVITRRIANLVVSGKIQQAKTNLFAKRECNNSLDYGSNEFILFKSIY